MSNKRDAKFEWLFANAFSLTISENEVLVKCGITEEPVSRDEGIVERIGLVLTPRGAKLLGYNLSNTVEQWEKANNVEVQLDLSAIAERTKRVSRGE